MAQEEVIWHCFNKGLGSNHQGLWLNIPASALALGNNNQPTVHASAKAR